MEYNRVVKLKNEKICTIRSAKYEDGPAVSDLFAKTHGESDFLLTYPEEHSFDVNGESEFLQKRFESDREVMLLAVVDDVIVANAGVSEVGNKFKVRHRAEFGIDVAKDYWGLGIGKALMNACIECAKEMGYKQLELDAVAENDRAIGMYKGAGFTEFGRNPMGFISKYSGVQELVYMRLEL